MRDDARDRPASTTLYRERILPSLAWWLVVAALIAMVAIAYGAALGTAIGMIVASGLTVLAAVGLVRSSPVIEVTPSVLRCARASIPLGLVAQVEAVDASRIATIRRGHDPKADDRTYVVLPPWYARTGIVVQVHDPQDPHSGWLIATRHPDQLQRVLTTRVAG